MGLFKSKEDKNREAFLSDYFSDWEQMVKQWKKAKVTPDRGTLSIVHQAAVDHAIRQARHRHDTGMDRQATADNLWQLAKLRYPNLPFGNPPTLA